MSWDLLGFPLVCLTRERPRYSPGATLARALPLTAVFQLSNALYFLAMRQVPEGTRGRGATVAGVEVVTREFSAQRFLGFQMP